MLESIEFDSLGRAKGVVNPLGAFSTTYAGASGRPDYENCPNGVRAGCQWHPGADPNAATGGATATGGHAVGGGRRDLREILDGMAGLLLF